jgi:hypothetical protein
MGQVQRVSVRVFLARSVSEGDHETTVRQQPREAETDVRYHHYWGAQGAIVVPLADASG